MSHFDAVKITKQELTVSQNIPVTHLNTRTIFETTGAMIGSVIKIDGIPFDTEDNEELNQFAFLWHNAIASLDSQFCVWLTVHRRRINLNLDGKFDNPFCEAVDARYRQKYNTEQLFKNDIFITLIYKGMTSGKVGKGLHFFSKLTDKFIKDARQESRARQIKKLTTAVEQLKATLQSFSPKVLGEDDNNYSELLSFLSLSVNAGELNQYRFPTNVTHISNSIEKAEKSLAQFPCGIISQFLPRKRLFFGEYIQFQGETRDDKRFGAIVSIKRYGSETTSVMFDPLMYLPGEFIATHSFAVETTEAALKLVGEQQRRLISAEDKAVSQIASLSDLQDKIASGNAAIGYHHNTIMLLAESTAELDTLIRKTVKKYADVGFVAVRETIGLEPAFWAQFPGNTHFIARSAPITSENFTDFCPLHNYRTGYINGNHLGSAVSILETPAKTPYYLNFHTKTEGNIPSKGHVIGVGGNGCGKTVFMTFMDSQLSRYQGQTFYFDRDRGAEIYIRAAGGYYTRLSPNFADDTQFNPLHLDDTPSNRKLNRELIGLMCREEGEDVLSAEVIDEITQCVDYAYNHLEKPFRTLSNAVKSLPINFARWRQLRRWLKADGKYSEGEYAYLFDNAEDKLSLHKKMGFDMTHFLDNEPEFVRSPVMMYLLHRIINAMNGQLVSIFFDEGWQYFIDPYWQKALQKLLPTIRKKNGHILLFTQSPNSIVNSPIAHVFKDNVATEIYFANPKADSEIYQSGMKLTTAEYDFVRRSVPEDRVFLLKQGKESVLCRLDLSHMQDYLPVFSGTQENVNKLDRLREQYGHAPKAWLKYFTGQEQCYHGECA